MVAVLTISRWVASAGAAGLAASAAFGWAAVRGAEAAGAGGAPAGAAESDWAAWSTPRLAADCWAPGAHAVDRRVSTARPMSRGWVRWFMMVVLSPPGLY